MQARTGGPFAVGSFDREWVLVLNRSGAEFCFAGHGASLVASLAGRERARARVVGVSADAQLAAALVSVGAERGGRAGDLHRAQEDQLRADAAWQLTGRHRSTIWKVLARHGVSRRRRSQPRQSSRRYEWAEAGALLHIDAFELPKFDRPGHWATGERAEPHETRRAGTVKVIGVIDDHTRLAYCEIHGAENKHTVSATLRRAAALVSRAGLRPGRGGDVRQREVLRHQPRVPRHS